MTEDETFLQLFCDDVINPIVDKCKLHESLIDQCFDIFEDDDYKYLDNLFEENFEMHTKCFENVDDNCDNACLDEIFWLHE